MFSKRFSIPFFNLILILTLAFSGLAALPKIAYAAGTISLSPSWTVYTENFDTLASTGTSSTVPVGWDFAESGTNANGLYTAGTGSNNAGDTYSFGASGSSERSFGGLLSGSLVPTIGASFTNDTGSIITSLNITYTGEQWRLGTLSREDRLDFQYSTDAATLTTGTWIDFNDLDFIAPATTGIIGALDGNSAANRTTLNSVISGLNIPNGSTFWIRWMDFNASGADDSLAIDDFSLIHNNEIVVADPIINEFVFNHVGTDTHEYVEIFGGADTDYSDYAVVQIEGDGTGAGVLDSIHMVGTTNGGGFWTTGFLGNAFENGTVTLLLVKDFTGSIGLDLDTNNDGVLNVTPWSNIVDSLAVSDGGTGDITYSTTVLGPGFGGNPFTPGGASRIPNSESTNNVSDWNLNDFDGAGLPGFTGTPDPGEALNTPSEINALVPLSLPSVVISQVYGGGGNSGSTYTHDFIELYNHGITIEDLSGWSVQYSSATGSTWQVTSLSGMLSPGQYYLVQQAAGAGGTTSLPAPDAVGTSAMGASAGKVALVNNTAGLTGTCPEGPQITDLVGYGSTASCYEGTGPAPAPSNINAILRANGGSTDTDNNAVDFAAGAPDPRNTSFGQEDQAPVVTNTTPYNGAMNVPVNAETSITFSEPVYVDEGWFSLQCSLSGSKTAVVEGVGSTTFTLNPDVDFAYNETCTLTVFADKVRDQDEVDPPDNMEVDYVVSFSIVGADVCETTFTPIYEIQGGSLATPYAGQTHITQGIVVGDYEGPSPTLRGFYLQDLIGDGDPLTSDGIFVFNGNNDAVSLGEVVRVTGVVAEFQDQTQISASSIISCGFGSVEPTDVILPFPSVDYLERYEGMLVRLPQTLYVTEHFQLGRFGQIVMSSGSRLQQPTNVTEPGAPALAVQAANNLNRIIVDDDLNNQNPDPILFGRGGAPLSASNTLRGGDTATGIVGILTYTWAGNAASGNAYRIRPVNALDGGVPEFQPVNPRPSASSDVGGSLKVVGLNLLNYFNTFSACTAGVGGAATDCRGAENIIEFERQWMKTVAAITEMDPDVLGVIEIENDGYGLDSAIQDLVNRLNAASAPSTFTFIDVDAATAQVNALGTDAIKVGVIYKPARVIPVGFTSALNSTAFVNGGDAEPRNRPALAQTFEQLTNGAQFTVVVNHLKSKGSACAAPDAGDGQGNCNIVRLKAANEMVSWMETDPTGAGDPDILILGDLNSYAKEDPIQALLSAGYINLIETFSGIDAYSYVFDGQWGYLDHALGSTSLLSQVSGVTEWHINSDEPSVLDYNTNFKSAAQISSLFAPDPFRVSDHDPVIVGLNLNAAPSVDAGGPYNVAERSSVNVSASGTDPDGDALTYAWDLNFDGVFETPGQSATFFAGDLDGPDSVTISVQVTDSKGLTAVDTTTVNIINSAPFVESNSDSQSVQYSDPVENVTITATDVPADIVLHMSVVWAYNGGSFSPGLPYGLSLSENLCGSHSCTWVLSGTAWLAPGTYTLRLSVSDKDEGVADHNITFNVLQEDALAAYTGAEFAATASTASSTASVTLAATIQDDMDGFPGDIRNATVTFVNRDNGNAYLCSAPVGLVNPNDTTTGTATCTWEVNLGNADSTDARVGILVNGYYHRNNTADDSILTVSRALTSSFITGGGNLLLSDSNGLLAGDSGSRNSFGLNVKYNRSGRNLQGRIHTLVISSGRVYQIKGNVLSSLVVDQEAGIAIFNGRASIQDVTDSDNPVDVDGNTTFQVTMTDHGEPGSSDSIAITVWNKDGGLYFSSHWDGVRTIEQVLAGGNLVVH